MRSLLSRSVRPTLGRSIPSGRLSTRFSVRKAGFPPIRKQFTFCDAFTILLAPVLTTAFVVEQTRKERRRQAWDKKIAAVQAETEALRGREVEAWTTLQRRSIRHGLHGHRRSYSTAVPVLRELEDDLHSSYETEHENSSQLLDGNLGEGKWSISAQLSDADRAIQRKWTRLISVRLALQMLTHLRIGDSEGYKQPPLMRLDPELFPQGMDGLVEKLRLVKGLMRGIAKQGVPFAILEPTDASRDLHVQITKLSDLMNLKQINLPTFVSGYCNIVAKSSEGFSTASLRLLMSALSRREHQQMASFVAGAMWESTQLLSEGDIRSMLGFYAKHMDALRIQKLLKSLTRNDSVPRPEQPWRMISIDGMQLAVPTVARHLVLERLIQATLRCKQTDFALAYTKIFHRDSHQAYCRMFVVNNFLGHYADTRDWTRGVEWLRHAKIRATSAVAHGLTEERLGLTILCMLDLCQACGQDGEYDNILEAAISARIKVPMTFAKIKSDTRRICKDWMERLQISNTSRMRNADSLVAKVSHFQEMLAKADPNLMPYVGIEDPNHIAELQKGIECPPPTVRKVFREHSLSAVHPVIRDDFRDRIASKIGKQFPIDLYREIYELSLRRTEAKVDNAANHPSTAGDEISWQSLLDELISWRSVYVKENAKMVSRRSTQDKVLLEAPLKSQNHSHFNEESKVNKPEKKSLLAKKMKFNNTRQSLDSEIAASDQEDEGYFSDSASTSSSLSPGFEANQASQKPKRSSRIGSSLPPPDYLTHHYTPALVEDFPG